MSEAPEASRAVIERFHGYLSLQARGLVALPPALRRRYQLDRPGAQVEVTEREDGVLEVRPVIAVPAAEAWFWTERWQAGEREVDNHVGAGEVVVSESADAFLTDLAALDQQAGADPAADPAADPTARPAVDRTLSTGSTAGGDAPVGQE